MAGVNIKNHVLYVPTASEQDFVDWSLLNAGLSLHSTVKFTLFGTYFCHIGSGQGRREGDFFLFFSRYTL